MEKNLAIKQQHESRITEATAMGTEEKQANIAKVLEKAPGRAKLHNGTERRISYD